MPPVKEKKICRAAVQTGSILARRVCRTKKEWDEIAARDATDTQNVLNARGGGLQPQGAQ